MTITKDYNLWNNLYFSQKKATATVGHVYEAKLYYTDGKGKKYYSLYQTDKDNKSVWKGYINADAVKEFTSTNYGKKVTTTKEYSIWKNFYFTQKMGSTKAGQVYEPKLYYTNGKGTKYYSLYQTDKNNKAVWKGYVNGDCLKPLTSTTIDKKVKVIKDTYGIHKNFYWTQKVDTAKTYLNQVLSAKREYVLGDGKVYYSIYDSKGTWLGYLGANATELYTEPVEYGKEIPKVTTLFKNDAIKIYDKPVEGKKEVDTSKDYYNKDQLITYDRESDDKQWVKVSVDGKELGWAEKSLLYTRASLLSYKKVKINEGGAILYKHPGESYKYTSGDKKGQDKVSYYSQKDWDMEYPYYTQIVTILASVTEGNKTYYKIKTPGKSSDLKTDIYWIDSEALSAETSSNKFYDQYTTTDVKGGRKYFKDINTPIYRYPWLNDGMNIVVARTGDFKDDYIFVDKEINIEGKIYQHILVNTADIGWIEKNSFKTNKIKAINSSLTGINRNENTFTGNPESLNPVPEGQNEKWVNWSTTKAYAYGIDKDGYEINSDDIKGTLIDTTKCNQSFDFKLSSSKTAATASATVKVRNDTGVKSEVGINSDYAKKYIIDNTKYCDPTPEIIEKYGQSASFGRTEIGSDGKPYNTWIEYQKHVHNYKATGFGGETIFTTQLFTPIYMSMVNNESPTVSNPQSITVMGDSIYSIYPKEKKSDYNRGILVKYNKSLITENKEDLRRLRYIWNENPQKFKQLLSKMSVSPELTIGHGQGLTNDGKNLYILDNTDKKDDSKNTYQTNTLLRVNPTAMVPEQLLTYRYIQRFDNNKGTAWSKTYSNNLAWKPGTNTFYTMFQQGEGADYVYEIQEHQIKSDGSITTDVKFRVKTEIGTFKVKADPRLIIQSIAYDSQNDAITLLGNGQYQAFTGTKDSAKVAYVGNLSDDKRESEGIAYDGSDIYLQLPGGSEILKAKNNY